MLSRDLAVSITRHLLVVPLAIPLSAAVSPSRLEERAGELGRDLGIAMASIHAACTPPPRPPLPPLPESGEIAIFGAPSVEPAALAGPAKKRGAKPGARTAKPGDVTGGIYIGKDTVLRLANAGVVPSGQPVAASGSHPAGILLSGVGALGVGLSDGDILTEVEGLPVRSEAQVVGMVIAARSRHAAQMSAIIWRPSAPAHEHPQGTQGTHNGERWTLVVAMPYL